MNNKTLDDWLQFIESLHHKVIDLGLERVNRVAERLNCTSFDSKVVMVAGTNGKGSCVHCLESIYVAAGYRVGAYTSPHLHHFNERIRISGKNIDDLTLIKAFEKIDKIRMAEPLSFFEFTTLAAFLIFQHYNLDIVILEIGLGGRLDAVNIVDPDISLITSIDLDHTDWLGQDREAIGFEKAGIFRNERPVVCGDPNPPNSLLLRAKECRSPFYQINEAFHYQELDFFNEWSWLSKEQIINGLPPISIKLQNAASSLMVVQLLLKDLPVSVDAIKIGLKQVKIPGRFEFWDLPVPCIFDVAHNPQAGQWLAQQLNFVACKGKRTAIVGMLNDKDIAETLLPLVPFIDRWHFGTLQVPRGATAIQISSILAAHEIKNCYYFDNIAEAVQAAIDAFNYFLPNKQQALTEMEKEVICEKNVFGNQLVVFGSFYTVSAAQTYLHKLRRR